MIDLDLNLTHAFKRFLRGASVNLSNIFKDTITRFTFLDRTCTFSDLTWGERTEENLDVYQLSVIHDDTYVFSY